MSRSFQGVNDHDFRSTLNFASKGYPVMELEGGFEAWKDNELDMEEESASRFKTSGERLSSRH